MPSKKKYITKAHVHKTKKYHSSYPEIIIMAHHKTHSITTPTKIILCILGSTMQIP